MGDPVSDRRQVDEVKLRAVAAIAEVLQSHLDMENKAKLLQWVLENIDAIVQGRVNESS